MWTRVKITHKGFRLPQITLAAEFALKHNGCADGFDVTSEFFMFYFESRHDADRFCDDCPIGTGWGIELDGTSIWATPSGERD